MESNTQFSRSFFVNSCSLASIATAEQASSLLELRDKLTKVDESCLYYHFWGARMYPHFVQSEHHNDFASWVYHRLHDHVLAERLSIIDPTEFNTLDALRQEVIETIDRRLDDYEIVHWTKREDRFHFICTSIIIFESSLVIERPQDLPSVIPMMSPGSIFYHFIDARMRTSDKMDDFSVWLETFGDAYKDLVQKIQAIDPYFLSLSQLKDELAEVIKGDFISRGQL